MQATCTRIMFPGEPFPRRDVAHAPRTAAQPGSATPRIQKADNRSPRQSPLPAEHKGRQLPMSAAQGVIDGAANNMRELPGPTSTSQVQPVVQLPEQGITILPSPRCSSSSGCAHERACQLTATPQEMQPEEQLPHSSAEAVSLERSAQDSKQLSERMMAPQEKRRRDDPQHSNADGASAARSAKTGLNEEQNSSDTRDVCGLGCEGKHAHLRDMSVSAVRSDSSASSISFYSPRALEPGSKADNGKAMKSFSFHKSSPSQGSPGPHGAASHPESNQHEMLHGQDPPVKEAPSAAPRAVFTL